MNAIHKLLVVIATIGVISLISNMSKHSASMERVVDAVEDAITTTNSEIDRSNESNINALINFGSHSNTQYVTNIYEADTGSFYLSHPDEGTPSKGYEKLGEIESHFQVQVQGNIVRTRVHQIFYNASNTWRQGVYVFPLPQNATVDSLTMHIGERAIKGEIKEKQAAQAMFDQAKKQGKSASIVQQIRPNMFVNKVANIAPGNSISVDIEYQQIINIEQGKYALRIPTAITPRYTPAKKPIVETEQAPLSSSMPSPLSSKGMTELEANTNQDSEQKGSAQTPYRKLKIDTIIDMGTPLKGIHAGHPQYTVEVSELGNHQYSVSFNQDDAAQKNDFVLHWELAESDAPKAVHTTQFIGEYQYGLVQIIPTQSQISGGSITPRELTLILDTSGSMVGDAIEQAKMSISWAIESLGEHDRFNIIEFNSRAKSLFEGAQLASTQNKAKALRFVRALQASGGTEMREALELALSLEYEAPIDEGKHALQQMIFITDGAVSNEAELLSMINNKLNNIRLFTVGIGSAPNTYFMSEAAIAGRGSYTLIGDVSQVEENMSALLSKIQQAALSDIELTFSSTVDEFEMYPPIVPDVYGKEAINLVYRFRPNAKQASTSALNISGTWHSQDKNDKYSPVLWQSILPAREIDNGQSNIVGKSALAKHWAYSKIRQLSRNLNLSPASGEDYMRLQNYTKSEITRIALSHEIVSKHTSLIAIDDQITRPSEEYLSMLNKQSEHLQSLRTQKWQAAGVSLPQTDAGTYAYIMWGALICALSGFALMLLGRSAS
ncbi:marine proteobacterial sortase target protein [Ningiella sp. W23]|uniref:marine proteobacterial sortase target protein n=1 Tax=Ningiella sp. W23 TaxID=3023715 RepID=UPI00375818E5